MWTDGLEEDEWGFVNYNMKEKLYKMVMRPKMHHGVNTW